MSARPNFLIIAAQKSGTIWFRENLAKHPEVYMARGATHFFNQNWEKGPEWYFDHFTPEGEKLIGEHCPSYVSNARGRNAAARAAERIDETLPGVKLLALLRNPVDRVYSAFVHHMTHERIPVDAELFDHLDSHLILEASRYTRTLGPFKERFGDRLLVFLNDDIKSDAGALYHSALEHIGADPSFRPDDLEAVVHSKLPPKESKYREGRGKRKLTFDERKRLYSHFGKDVKALEQLLGRDLSAWRPQPDAAGAPVDDERTRRRAERRAADPERAARRAERRAAAGDVDPERAAKRAQRRAARAAAGDEDPKRAQRRAARAAAGDEDPKRAAKRAERRAEKERLASGKPSGD